MNRVAHFVEANKKAILLNLALVGATVVTTVIALRDADGAAELTMDEHADSAIELANDK